MIFLMALSLTASAGNIISTPVHELPDEEWLYGQSILLHGTSSAFFQEGKWIYEGSLLDLSNKLYLRRDGIDISTTIAAIRTDSIRIAVREVLFSLKWPGTPWLGGEAFTGTYNPFIQGFSYPLIDENFQSPDSIEGIGFQAGGIIGFNGFARFFRVKGEDLHLSTYGIDAPWLGFGTFGFDRICRSDGLDYRVLNAMLNMKYIRPYFILFHQKEPSDSWGFMSELRGFCVSRSRTRSIFLIPRFIYASDSLGFSSEAVVDKSKNAELEINVTSTRYILSGSLTGGLLFNSDEQFYFRTKLSFLSRDGIEYNLLGDYIDSDEYSCFLDAVYRNRNAGVGGGFEIYPDSLRLVFRAMYNPRNDVSVHLDISGAAESNTDPAGMLTTAVSAGSVTGLIKLIWIDNETSVQFIGTGWF